MSDTFADPDPEPDLQGTSVTVTDTVPEVYVQAVGNIPELMSGDAGWLPNDERVQSLIDRGLLEAVDPPQT